MVHGVTTSHLWSHLGSCGLYKRAKGKTAGLITISEQDDNEVVSSVWVNEKWDPMKDRELLAKMIVGHELPFFFSEYSIFHSYMKYNNPLWQKVSRMTITRECMKVVESEKNKLKKVFKNINRISLTSDCWTSMNFRRCSKAMKISFSLKQEVLFPLLSLLLKTQLCSLHLLNRVCLGTVTNPREGVFDQMGRDPFYLCYYQTLILDPISPTSYPLFLGLPNLFLCTIQLDKPFVRSILKEDIRLAIVGIGLI
jgi:hypothetical protein